MSDYIDAKGLGCAEPVLLARQSLKSHDEVTIVVDTRTSLENIKALAMYTGSAIEIAEKPGGTYLVILRREPGGDAWSSGPGNNGNKEGAES
jgi:TusA-related sulfurtransferase